MPFPFTVTAIDMDLGGRVDLRTPAGTSTVGYAQVQGYVRGALVTASEVYSTKRDNVTTASLRSAAVGPSATPDTTLATYVRANASNTRSLTGCVQTADGDVVGYMLSVNTSNMVPQLAFFNGSFSTTLSAEYRGVSRTSVDGEIGWASFDDGTIADIAVEAYV